MFMSCTCWLHLANRMQWLRDSFEAIQKWIVSRFRDGRPRHRDDLFSRQTSKSARRHRRVFRCIAWNTSISRSPVTANTNGIRNFRAETAHRSLCHVDSIRLNKTRVWKVGEYPFSNRIICLFASCLWLVQAIFHCGHLRSHCIQIEIRCNSAHIIDVNTSGKRMGCR